jgi:hypothetical protein
VAVGQGEGRVQCQSRRFRGAGGRRVDVVRGCDDLQQALVDLPY